jgi:integrase
MVFIHVWPNLAKSLKTRSSQRTLPLVGYSKLALEQALKQADDAHLFPKYIRDAKSYATNASNALSKWLKKDFDGLNAHCLRHTFRDRLRAVECAMDHIGGCELVNSI